MSVSFLAAAARRAVDADAHAATCGGASDHSPLHPDHPLLSLDIVTLIAAATVSDDLHQAMVVCKRWSQPFAAERLRRSITLTVGGIPSRVAPKRKLVVPPEVLSQRVICLLYTSPSPRDS